ncbi:MAG: hypothetical protein IPG80_18980 [Anaerolineales bacterium]|jgi:hypothetical protein|uniref:hypothetical protein n=1 Tax=Candidatus Villigracilis vicinus TaxID=3140679 RepID=UPI003136209C|nr:hypothetical protein [Anaerolineales bacterium]MBK7447933.1 hypothetical protein [Anaerolineales bacterium]MBK9779305.1 hypothetical protein [Anaerolineales bacterium]
MAFTVILHIANEASVAGEVDELPKAADTIITIMNPRQKDGKDLHYIDQGTVKVIWPLAKVSFIEIMGDSEEEKIIGFVRE